MNSYIGHQLQMYGIEEYRLVGGKGDGMRLLEVRNGKGLEMKILPDRGCDISRLTFKGNNMSFFSPCGYVHPAYYQKSGTDWLRSFTAGFLTTCGLDNVGPACCDDGECLPFHGSMANTPAEHCFWHLNEEELIIEAQIPDEVIFGRKLKLTRKIFVSLQENKFTIEDTIENTGEVRQPFEILYHLNMGYPLLDEDSIVEISSVGVLPRDEHAKEDLENWNQMIKPEPGYQERCYYHKFADGTGSASIFQPKLGQGLRITFDAEKLDGFVEWKQMGVRDYALGLECGNCYPAGRDVMRKNGMLKFLDVGERITYRVNIEMLEANQK